MKWTQIATPSGPATALRVECRHEPGAHGRYRLLAFDGDRQVHSADYAWNEWMGHACGQLLMPDFVEAASRAAGVQPPGRTAVNDSQNQDSIATAALSAELERELRAAVNPLYEDVRGTESYERKRLLGEIDRLRALCREAYHELNCGDEGDVLERTHYCGRCDNSIDRNGTLRGKLAMAFVLVPGKGSAVPPAPLTRFYHYRSVMERQPTSTEEGRGIMVVVIPSGTTALALLVDLQSRNDGASLTNVAERVVERATKDLLAPAGIDPRTVSWVESDSEGWFYRLHLDLSPDGKSTGTPDWKPVGRTHLEDFLAAYPGAGQQAWDIAKGYVGNQGW